MKRSTKRAAIIAGLLTASVITIGINFAGEKEDAKRDGAAVSTSSIAGSSEDDAQAKAALQWWDERLQAAEKAGRWDLAADYAYRKAAYYRSVNRVQDAEQWLAASDGYWSKSGTAKDGRFYDISVADAGSVTLTPYVSVPAGEKRTNMAKHEPVAGAYLGMFGIFDYPGVKAAYGTYHPIGLTYSGWPRDENDTRNYFPTRMISSVKESGAGALQIGWEPQYGLDRVVDDAYVRSFAQQAKESGIPIFIRYASEMNGAWVPWYDEPQKYVEKFRLMASIMHEVAPNVAMVWSPNFWPNDNIDAYYPGDEYVDWVGFSLYGTPLFDGKEDFSQNMIDYFKPLYDKYKHKPIMISEGAIGHYVTTTKASYGRWAANQTSIMYGYLPRMFPQVKAITYFNMTRQRSESLKSEFIYDLSDNPVMFDQYRRLIEGNAFLTKVEQGSTTKDNVRYVPLSEAPSLAGKHKLFVYPDTPYDTPPQSIVVYQGDKKLAAAYEVPYEVELDFSKLDPAVPLTIVASNFKQETIAKQSFIIPRK